MNQSESKPNRRDLFTTDRSKLFENVDVVPAPKLHPNERVNPEIAPVDETPHPAKQSDKEGLKLPELHEGLLSKNMLHQLFSDIIKCTRIIGVIAKHHKKGFVDGTNISLRQAEQMLNSQQVKAIQLRYIYEGAEWWDTLMPTPQGTCLIRICHNQ